MQKKIDVHGHYFPPAYVEALHRHHIDLLDGIHQPQWSEECQLELMESLNISTTVLSLSSPHFHFGDGEETENIARACNEYGTALKEKYPGKFMVMASLPFPNITKCVEEIKYCHEHLGLDGFALQSNFLGTYLGDQCFQPVMEALEECSAVVVFHPTAEVGNQMHLSTPLPAAFMEYFFETTRAITNMLLAGTFRQYPHIRFIIPHGGAFLPILADRLEVLGKYFHLNNIDIMEDLKGLYYDLAGISMPKQFELLQKITEESHLLYGTDEPFTPLALCQKLAMDMEQKMTQEQLENICWHNPTKLFSKI